MTNPDVERDLTPGSELHPPAVVETDLTDDPYYTPAWTRALESIERAESGIAGRPVRRPGFTPGESEFSWGKGRMAPPDLADPSLWDQMRAVYRTDPADPAAVANYDGEWSR